MVSKRLNGLPSSKGYYEGPVKIVRGLSDIGKLARGDVLVIPYSDVSWTPLFSKTGALISESGGILSHCSVIAREYGIPAVAEDGATRITDNTRVIVDGYTGLIHRLSSDHFSFSKKRMGFRVFLVCIGFLL